MGKELSQIQDICRDRATLIMDEFYGGYNYTSDCDGSVISAADNIEDVDEDDVLIIDGLTKRFRLPGWRVAWIVGPKEVGQRGFLQHAWPLAILLRSQYETKLLS